MTIDLQNL